jgi:hypothetical protein
VGEKALVTGGCGGTGGVGGGYGGGVGLKSWVGQGGDCTVPGLKVGSFVDPAVCPSTLVFVL